MLLEQEVEVRLTPRLRANFIKKGYPFASKYKVFLASDGHACDSGAERLIDDFLTRHEIQHEFHPKYPVHPTLNPKGSLTADWRLERGGRWVEYFGVTGNARYEEQRQRKYQLARELKLNVVFLELEDLDPPRLRAKLLGEHEA